jgi:hypothetical protein
MMFRVSILTIAFVTTLVTASPAQTLTALSADSRALLAEDGSRTAWQAAPPKTDSRLNGFLIGFAAGAVPGILLGMGLRQYCENEAASCPAAVPIAGILTGFIGGGIGYAIDGAIHGQSLTFGRPRPSPAMRVSIKF